MTDHQDTIDIELVVEAVRSGQQNIHMQGALVILINGERPYEEGDLVDSGKLLESLNKPGTYFIFTCSCGIPQCAGYENGIRVLHEGGKITWKDLDRNVTWVFDQEKMKRWCPICRKKPKTTAYFS